MTDGFKCSLNSALRYDAQMLVQELLIDPYVRQDALCDEPKHKGDVECSTTATADRSGILAGVRDLQRTLGLADVPLSTFESIKRLSANYKSLIETQKASGQIGDSTEKKETARADRIANAMDAREEECKVLVPYLKNPSTCELTGRGVTDFSAYLAVDRSISARLDAQCQRPGAAPAALCAAPMAADRARVIAEIEGLLGQLQSASDPKEALQRLQAHAAHGVERAQEIMRTGRDANASGLNTHEFMLKAIDTLRKECSPKPADAVPRSKPALPIQPTLPGPTSPAKRETGMSQV